MIHGIHISISFLNDYGITIAHIIQLQRRLLTGLAIRQAMCLEVVNTELSKQDVTAVNCDIGRLEVQPTVVRLRGSSRDCFGYRSYRAYASTVLNSSCFTL